MSDEELEIYRNRPLPSETEWKREIVERSISHEEFLLIEKQRLSPKNELGQANVEALPEEKKEKAVDAFMAQGPAKVSQAQINNARKYGFWNLDPYGNSTPEEKWVTLPWYRAIFHWLRGRKVEKRLIEEPKTWQDFMNQKDLDN